MAPPRVRRACQPVPQRDFANPKLKERCSSGEVLKHGDARIEVDTSHVPKASLDKWREWKPRDLKKHTGLTNMRDTNGN